MEDDQFTVLGALDVVLHPRETEVGGRVDGGERVLGRVRGGAPVGDGHHRAVGAGGLGARDGEQGRGQAHEHTGDSGDGAETHADS